MRAVRAVGWEAWVWALAAFAAVFTLLFTVFLTNPAGLWDGLHDGLAYWLGQHGPGPRREGVVLLHRRPVRGGVARAAARRGRRDRRAAPPDAAQALPDLGLRALARGLQLGERALHVARAAPAAAAAAARRARRAGDLGRAPALDGPARPRGRRAVRGRDRAHARGARTSRTAPTRASSSSPRSRRTQVRDVRDEVEAVAARAEREGRDVSILVDAAEGATLPVGVVLPRPAGRLPRPRARRPSCPRTPTSRSSPRATAPASSPPSPATTARRFPFRVWWIRDYGKMSADGWWRWFTEREPWNPTGGMQEWLYVRQGA